ncbi:MAG TPA: hypothetical protein VMR86_16970 [Myxococcota bacterium]|nr:hypothetical protein [Myxococcota bacterium]
MRWIHGLVVCAALGAAVACKSPSPAQPLESPSAAAPQPASADPWPRQLPFGDGSLVVYQPQVESWQGNQIQFRAAVAFRSASGDAQHYGVIWASARTDVNRELRQVTLSDLALTRSSFPGVSDDGADYLAVLRQELPLQSRTVSLDRLVASLSANTSASAQGAPVKNDVPRILVSQVPAILIPVDGKPVMRAVEGQSLERVINTRALIARVPGGTTYYLHVYDGWLSAASLDGPWQAAAAAPSGLDATAESLGKEGLVDLLDGGRADPKPSLANGAPVIYLSQVPSELIVLKGPPETTPIPDTVLRWCTNTASDLIFDEAHASYYLLVSGRWYRAASLDGPWTYVASGDLPGDFRKIPPESPAGVVLASIAGTPQAREAAIENSIPNTGTISSDDPPRFDASYDGEPRFAPIAGTPLQYAVNSPAPVILVDPHSYYALRAGVWFAATGSFGPWVVARSVPAVIYAIPTSSALHYVTYVHIYGATDTEIYTGYTPGYLGTVVEPDGVVVYGTGYAYQPWVGTVYYPPPVTYGIAAVPVYGPATGWTYGYGMGLATAAVVDSWASPYAYSAAYHGYPCCGSASANVYGQYGNVKTTGTTTWATTSNGTIGQSSGGTYHNQATGTTGNYNANRSYNPYTGQGQRSYSRSIDTPGGDTGDVSRKQTYNAATGAESYSGSESYTGQKGNEVSHSESVSSQPGERPSVESSSSVTSARTGQTYTSPGANDHYAGSDGSVYRRNGDGWQSNSGGGWQDSHGDNSWANREEAARGEGENRVNGMQNAGGERGGGEGHWGDHDGGGGFGDRYGGRGGGGFGGGRGGGGRRR